MQLNTYRRWSRSLPILLAIGLLFSLVTIRPAAAVTLDSAARALRDRQRVYDFARVLSPADQRRIQLRLEALEQRGLAEGVVVIADRLEDLTIQELALGLAERWKVGRKDVGNGFVLAVSIADRKRWLEVGRDLQGFITDADATRLTSDTLVAPFREERYGEGLDAAVAAIEQRLEKAGGVEALPVRAPAPQPSPLAGFLTLVLGGLTALTASRAWPRGSVPGKDPWRLPAIGLGFGALACAVLGLLQAPQGGLQLAAVAALPAGWAVLRLLEGAWIPLDLNTAHEKRKPVVTGYWAAVAAIAIWMLMSASPLVVGFVILAVPFGLAIPGYFARVPRKCPECTGALRWLPEAEEPQFLRDDENLEQQIGSVDYDIWRCQKCERSAVFSHTRPFAPYQQCPRCHRRTLSTRTVIDDEPTAWQDGLASDVTECRNPRCNYRDVIRQRRVERGGYRD
ncbi:MAG: hypothetical protein K0Q72_3625, partial [Armatimonadetes bacterium]|nr:hypothetical protein [Armatimonadota bacterium]